MYKNIIYIYNFGYKCFNIEPQRLENQPERSESFVPKKSWAIKFVGQEKHRHTNKATPPSAAPEYINERATIKCAANDQTTSLRARTQKHGLTAN